MTALSASIKKRTSASHGSSLGFRHYSSQSGAWRKSLHFSVPKLSLYRLNLGGQDSVLLSERRHVEMRATPMFKSFCLLPSLFAVCICLSLQHCFAEAVAKGWRCEYRLEDGSHHGRHVYYCFGTNLNETRARAKERCSRYQYCQTGACSPLDFAPGSSCGK